MPLYLFRTLCRSGFSVTVLTTGASWLTQLSYPNSTSLGDGNVDVALLCRLSCPHKVRIAQKICKFDQGLLECASYSCLPVHWQALVLVANLDRFRFGNKQAHGVYLIRSGQATGSWVPFWEPARPQWAHFADFGSRTGKHIEEERQDALLSGALGTGVEIGQVWDTGYRCSPCASSARLLQGTL